MPKPITQPPDDHLLMWRMVNALEIPMDEAIRSGKLAVQHLSKMLDCCARCSATHYCSIYLGNREDHAEERPSFCCIRKGLDALLTAFPVVATEVS